MQEYRFRLILGLSGFFELFGVGHIAPRALAAALPAGGSIPMDGLEFPRNHARSAAAVPQSSKKRSTPLAGKAADAFEPRHFHVPPHYLRHRIIVPVTGIHQGTLTALRYAHSLSSDVTAVHVSMDQKENDELQKQWPVWGEGIRLVVLDSPHQMVLEPLLEYIQGLMAIRRPYEIITIVVPQSVRPRWWLNLMRTQMASLLRLSLPFETGVVITDVPYLLDGDAE
jgi:hypothetical protein